MTPHLSVAPLSASRFLQRWLEADTQRQPLLEEMSRLSLSPAIFAQILQKEMLRGATLNKAMRRLRNLVICTLIKRDLENKADLNEVVTTISEFADFVVQQHLLELHAELSAIHGIPIGEDSGTEQEMIV